MQKSISSEATTSHPGNLNIGKVPYRTGSYLMLEQGSVSYALARFRNEDEVERFIKFAKECSELGLKIVWKGDGEEGDSQEPA